MTESAQDALQDSPDPLDRVPAWVTVPDLAERYGERLATVRRWLDDRDLIGVRRGPNKALSVPEAFLDEHGADRGAVVAHEQPVAQHGPLPALRGTFTVLADGGMDDTEVIGWLFAPDATLPVDGAPIDAIRAGFKTEVRRRAMETAF